MVTRAAGFSLSRSDQEWLRIRLELQEPEEERFGEWTLRARATVTVAGEPRRDVPVQFYINDKPEGNPEPTDDEGCVNHTFPNLGERNYEFEVRIPGIDAKATKSKRIKPKVLNVQLELTEPTETEPGTGKWEITATAFVTDKDKQPISPVNIQFYLNGRPEGAQVTTHNDGRAPKDFTLERGNYTFEVQVVGTSARARASKTLKEEKPRKPAKIRVTVMPAGAMRRLFFQILTEDDLPVKNAIIRIYDPEHPDGYFNTKPTVRDGAASCEIAAPATHRKTLKVVVLGSDIETPVNLFS